VSWPLAKLSDVCEINIGKTPARANSDYWRKGNPWLSIRDMSQGKELRTTKEEISDLGVKESNIKLVPKGTVLFSFKLSIGKIGVTQRDMYTNEAIAALPIKDKSILCEEYLVYALTRIDAGKTTDRAVMGATLNKKKLAELNIPLPPLEQQKHIAAILEKADAIRRTRQQAIDLTDQLLRSVFLDMFGDPVTNPKGWEQAEMGKMLEIITYGLTVRPKYVDSGYKLISAKEIRSGNVNFGDAPFISEVDFEKLSDKGKPKKGEILFSKTGSIGHCAIIETEERFAITQNVARLSFNQDMLLSEFALYLLRTDHIQRLAKLRAKGNAVKDLQLGDMKEFLIYVPPLCEQEIFIQVVRKQKEFMNKLLSANDLAMLNFDSLAQRSFRGELTNQTEAA